MSLQIRSFSISESDKTKPHRPSRQLAYVDTWPEAPENVPCVVFFHGFPGSCTQGVQLCLDSFPSRLRVVAFDRPGLGESTHDPHRSLLTVAQDVQSLLHKMGVKKTYLLGISGGSPFATATAFHLQQDRLGPKIEVLKLGLICPLGSLADLTNQKAMKIMFLVRLYRTLPWTGKFVFWLWRTVFQANPKARMKNVISTYPKQDQKVVSTPQALQELVDYFLSAMKQGTHGLLQDIECYLEPWPFDPQQIKVQALLWHGTVDTIVPYSVGMWYQKAWPKLIVKTYPNEGHFSLPILYMGEILSELIDEPQRVS